MIQVENPTKRYGNVLIPFIIYSFCGDRIPSRRNTGYETIACRR